MLRLRLCMSDVVNKQKEAASEESLGDGKAGYENRAQRQWQERSSAVVLRLTPIRSRCASRDIRQVGVRNVSAF